MVGLSVLHKRCAYLIPPSWQRTTRWQRRPSAHKGGQQDAGLPSSAAYLALLWPHVLYGERAL